MTSADGAQEGEFIETHIKTFNDVLTDLCWISRREVMNAFGYRSISGFNKFIARNKNFPAPVKHAGLQGRIYYSRDEINKFGKEFFKTNLVKKRPQFVGPCRELLKTEFKYNQEYEYEAYTQEEDIENLPAYC